MNPINKIAIAAAIVATGTIAYVAVNDGEGSPELLSCWQHPADEDGYGRADARVSGDIVEVKFTFTDGTRFWSDGYSNDLYRQSVYFDSNRLSTGNGDYEDRPTMFWTTFDSDSGDFSYYPTAPLASCEARTGDGEYLTVTGTTD